MDMTHTGLVVLICMLAVVGVAVVARAVGIARGACPPRRHSPKLDVKPLAAVDRERFVEHWQIIQGHSVEHLQAAVRDAQCLTEEVMRLRGFPLDDWDEREAEVSAVRPDVAGSFRRVRDIAGRSQAGQASTDDLRQAMRCYRVLFDDLLEARLHQGGPPASSQPPIEAPSMVRLPS